MYSLPFDKPGRFWRGNIHCHSNRSDGLLTPDEVAAAYRAEGYDFIALTDHFHRYGGAGVTDTRPLRTGDFTTLLGAELHAPRMENGVEWHIVAVGLPADFAAPVRGETAPELAARAAEAGAFIGVAHPAAYTMTLADALSIESAHAVEIHNAVVARNWDRGDGWYMSELLAAQGRRLTAFAADDAHFKTPTDRFGAWVHVRAERLDPDALLAALKAGHYYSSQGPEIHEIALVDGAIRISCTPVNTIAVTGAADRKYFRTGEAMTTHAFPLDVFAGSYCRVTVIDAAGKRAWSNPIWL